MSTPDHYRMAEQLLTDADSYEDDRAFGLAQERRTEALVHAALAVADRLASAHDWRTGADGPLWSGSHSAEYSCDGIALNGVHTQIINCKQVPDRHELHLWRTGHEWFTCRGEAA